MEAVRVSRAGFPVRIHHEDFISRYSLLTARLSSGIQSQGIESKTFINNMLQMLGAQDTDFRIGLTKVFFRRSLHDRLEEDDDVRQLEAGFAAPTATVVSGASPVAIASISSSSARSWETTMAPPRQRCSI